MQDTSIGFIGAGNMATSLIHGLINKGTPGESIWASDIDTDKLHSLAGDCGINAATPEQTVQSADTLVLAVKPQVMEGVCKTLIDALPAGSNKPLFVSIAAGITLSSLERWLGEDAAIVRCMPNTPALVGMGASGLFANARVNDTQRQTALQLMEAVGIANWVNQEADLDAVTAVSGSGPAYFFLFMEAMQETAIEMGLSAELARQLVYQTAAGAAELASQSDDDVAELRRKVTSPGGTTEQAIARFENGGLRELVRKALLAARDRSVELAGSAESK